MNATERKESLARLRLWLADIPTQKAELERNAAMFRRIVSSPTANPVYLKKNQEQLSRYEQCLKNLPANEASLNIQIQELEAEESLKQAQTQAAIDAANARSRRIVAHGEMLRAHELAVIDRQIELARLQAGDIQPITQQDRLLPGVVTSKRPKQVRDEAIRKVWGRRKGDKNYAIICRRLDDQNILPLDHWGGTWTAALAGIYKDAVIKYIQTALKPKLKKHIKAGPSRVLAMR